MRVILSGGVVALSLLASPGFAATAPAWQKGFVDSCESQMYMSAPACTCMAGIAGTSSTPMPSPISASAPPT